MIMPICNLNSCMLISNLFKCYWMNISEREMLKINIQYSMPFLFLVYLCIQGLCLVLTHNLLKSVALDNSSIGIRPVWNQSRLLRVTNCLQRLIQTKVIFCCLDRPGYIYMYQACVRLQFMLSNLCEIIFEFYDFIT